MRHRDFEKQLNGYRLTTAEILYHLPDHPELLQTFIWQTMDLAPNFPAIRKFLKYWQESLDGKLHSVKIASRGLIKPAEYKIIDSSMYLH